MANKKIRVKITTLASFKWVAIDDVFLSFIDDLSKEIELQVEKRYCLGWFLRGAPGTRYQLEIVDTKIKINKKIAQDEQGAMGTLYFRLTQEAK